MKLQFVIGRARAFISAALVVAFALSPFGIYMVAGRDEKTVTTTFPAPIALLTVQRGNLVELGVLVSTPIPGIVRLPANTAITLPRAGTLRASTILEVAGPEAVTDALSNTLRIDIPFWIQAEGKNVGTAFSKVIGTNLGDHQRDAAAIFTRARKSVFRGSGQTVVVGVTRSFQMNAPVIRAALRNPTLRVAPKPSPTIAPDDIDVEVLNKTGVAGVAREVATDLGAKGFNVLGTANSDLDRPATTDVYYVRNKAAGDLVAASLGLSRLRATALPDGIEARGDVIVAVGRDLITDEDA